MSKFWFLVCIVAAGAGVWKAWSERTQSHPPGIVAPDTPYQKNLTKPVELTRGEHRLVGRAEFDITARVILKMRYRFDKFAAVSPVDFALGWGEMSDSAILDQMSCSQSSRFYGCSWKNRDVIEPSRMMALSANMHLIPATPEVEDALMRVRRGQVVNLRGLLVDVVGPDGGWNTSLTREDSGPGGCEIILVGAVSTS
jgi:hypothetical protein